MSTTVSINGVAVTTDTLGGVSVNYGRQGIDGQVQPSSATFQLIALDEQAPDVNIRDLVEIKTDGDHLFYGKVTDTSLQLAYVSDTRVGTITTVIATGSLAELGRIYVGNSIYPSELDGARASRIITEAAPTIPLIDQVTSPISEYFLSYDEVAGARIETIDTGSVTLISRAANSQRALDLLGSEVQESAGSPGVYETADGRLGYADARRRSVNTGGITIAADYIADGLNPSKRVGDLINTVTVAYGTASPQASTTFQDAYSTYAYSILQKTITSQLSLLNQAEDLGKRIVNVRSIPRLNLQQLVIDVSNPDLPTPTYEALLAPRFGTPITVTDLDTRIGLGSTWKGFIEGWTATITKDRHTLTLFVSDRVYSLLLANVDDLSSAIDRLEGAVNGLAELWAPDPDINQIGNTLNSQSAITIDRAYKIGA